MHRIFRLNITIFHKLPMGNNNSHSVAVTVDHENEIYYNDEIINGIVQLTVNAQNIVLEEINIGFIGEIISSNGGDSAYVSVVPFFRLIFNLIKPEIGQKNLTFHRGTYSWPFSFQLVNYLPPSTYSYLPDVRYQLQILLGRYWNITAFNKTLYIICSPRINQIPMNYYSNSPILRDFNSGGKQIKFEGSLNKTNFSPGETIELNVKIENFQRIPLSGIDIFMMQKVEAAGQRRDSQIVKTTMPIQKDTQPQLIEQIFPIVIPSKEIAPSFIFGKEGETLHFVRISYRIIFKIEANGQLINSDFSVDIPFVMETIRHLK